MTPDAFSAARELAEKCDRWLNPIADDKLLARLRN